MSRQFVWDGESYFVESEGSNLVIKKEASGETFTVSTADARQEALDYRNYVSLKATAYNSIAGATYISHESSIYRVSPKPYENGFWVSELTEGHIGSVYDDNLMGVANTANLSACQEVVRFARAALQELNASTLSAL